MFLILVGSKGINWNLDNSGCFPGFIGKCLKAEINIFAKIFGDIFMKDNVNIAK